MVELPEPHPLDFDWRFTASTIKEISELLPRLLPVLAVGAPSLARALQGEGRDVLLIDRQPIQGVRSHLPIEVGSVLAAKGLPSFAVVDPPWYPADLTRWIAWVANLVGAEGSIIVSIWPESTRATAADEVDSFFRWCSAWAKVELLTMVPQYETPVFEKESILFSSVNDLSRSPGFGRLIKIRVLDIPKIPREQRTQSSWLRFILNNYQLALRLDLQEPTKPALVPHPQSIGWRWPFVSRRAPEREMISLWSSRNEVAIINNSNDLASCLRSAFKADNGADFLQLLGAYPSLLEWELPKPPYWRYLEWCHQQ